MQEEHGRTPSTQPIIKILSRVGVATRVTKIGAGANVLLVLMWLPIILRKLFLVISDFATKQMTAGLHGSKHILIQRTNILPTLPLPRNKITTASEWKIQPAGRCFL